MAKLRIKWGDKHGRLDADDATLLGLAAMVLTGFCAGLYAKHRSGGGAGAARNLPPSNEPRHLDQENR